jgi:hypothetical protein
MDPWSATVIFFLILVDERIDLKLFRDFNPYGGLGDFSPAYFLQDALR